MGDAIVVGILIVVVFCALSSSVKHFKGRGGCCGSSDTVRESKKLADPIVGEKVIQIEGMHCENCRNRIEHAINRLDGVTCKINLKNQAAIVSYSEQVEDSVLKAGVEELGYKVVSISKK